MNRRAFIEITGKTPEQAAHEVKMRQRAEDLPRVDALLAAGWKFELPEIVNGHGNETEPMSWYWRSPPKRKGSKGRKYWSTGQAYNALMKAGS